MDIIEKHSMERFLVGCAVPKTNKKGYENGRLYDCIWRAHRDVMVGVRREDTFKEYKKMHSTIIDELYSLILNSNDAVYSELLLTALSKYDIEFGALQKLVNMTLKYIVILKTYNELENISVCIKKCDCPIDSKILGCKQVNCSHLKWTSNEFDEEDYKLVQEKIAKTEDGKSSKLKFDFENWNK
jgi:hypothetical protein